MPFRVSYNTKIKHKDWLQTYGGTLKSGFETYEEASEYVEWAKKNLVHDSYEIEKC